MVNCGVPHHVSIVSALSFTKLFNLGSAYCVMSKKKDKKFALLPYFQDQALSKWYLRLIFLEIFLLSPYFQIITWALYQLGTWQGFVGKHQDPFSAILSTIRFQDPIHSKSTQQIFKGLPPLNLFCKVVIFCLLFKRD